MRVLLQGIVGSHAYGLNHAHSDIDRLAIGQRPTDEYLGIRLPNDESKFTTEVDGDDITVHEVGKFCRLAMVANPTVSELLWLSGYEVLADAGRELVEMREAFLSAKPVRSSYLGYATSQLKGAERGKSEAERQKFGRHLYRLVHQGVSLHRTGRLELVVPDREAAFEHGRVAATGDLDGLRKLLAWAEDEFDKPTPLPVETEYEKVNDWLVNLRRSTL